MPQFAYLESKADERRGSARRRVRLSASGAASGGNPAALVVHDISDTGVLLEGSLELLRGEELEIVLPQLGARRLSVAWTSGRFFGCEFVDSAPAKAAAPAGIDAQPEKGSPEAIARASYQLEELSRAIARISNVLDRAIHQLGKRER